MSCMAHATLSRLSAAETAWCDPAECSPPAHRGNAVRTWMKDAYIYATHIYVPSYSCAQKEHIHYMHIHIQITDACILCIYICNEYV